VTDTNEKPWSPPFCANETDLDCPSCGEDASVFVREEEHYCDGAVIEAYCGTCHQALEVYANVSIEFTDPEVTA